MLTNIAIVEDSRDFRRTLKNFIDEAPGFRCVFDCDTAESALKTVPELRPDVVLMDIHLPNMSGIACTRKLKELCPAIRILILTVYEDNERIFDALKAGATGYLLKRTVSTEIIRAISEVMAGGAPMSSQIAYRVVQSFYEAPRILPKEQQLSRREEEILEKLSKGYKTKEIASQLCISAHTVHSHMQHIYEKLHVCSKTEAVLKFLG
jgi:DNA-binding NarL/FixJ family response regulator